jgi:magnesium-protoporphyrin O-methyltransferase
LNPVILSISDMNCCHAQEQCAGLEQLFDSGMARADLNEYQKNGPGKITHWLLEAIQQAMQGKLQGASLLDIGGGVGVIQHELAQAGAGEVVGVDASTAYLDIAKAEAEKRGYAERTRYHFGDFATLAPDIAPADMVTLERVICCYPDMRALVQASSARAKQVYAVVYPRDVWWMKAGRELLNFGMRLFRRKFRFFVHPTSEVEAIVQANGLTRQFYRASWVWQVVVYRRQTPDL